MQSGGGGGDRALVDREHGLIVGGIALVGRAFGSDVGRQRRAAELGDRLVERRPVKRERQRDLAVLALVLDLGVEMAEQAHLALIAEPHHVARRQLLRRLHQGLPARAVETFDQRRLDLRLGVAADAAAFQLGRDHLGVVDHELVARLQPLRQVGHARSRSTPPGCTTSIRAESRGLAGRSAMFSAGSSKSKRSVRMITFYARLIPRERRLRRVSKDEVTRCVSWFETRASHAPRP